MKDLQRPELLAPAGNYEAFLGAISAGADAVYLGGQKFGARAYADNFDTQQVIRAINYAHLYGRKLYMTVNTLVKEEEFDDLYDYLAPFAQAGLDGVIVQDFGVWGFVKEHFPNVELHASTQMAVTGVYGARLLKKMGAVRVVPARELSLQEMIDIKEKAGIEVEAFIHGAMCYCYSGMCLFSSIVGGRSGNRGRCAQPCRLPYFVHGGLSQSANDRSFSASDNTSEDDEYYPLSLKDMCTIEIIPSLIEAGIDSFKIEGRMKKPEYVAGVVSIYRKYIDKYLEDPKAPFKVDPKDLDVLRHLYLRTEISQGYYQRHNSRDMVTLSSPGYSGSDDRLIASIRDTYLTGERKRNIEAYGYFHPGCESMLTLSLGDVSVTVSGQVVQEASKRPLSKDDLAQRIMKLGDTFFELRKEDLTIDMDESDPGIFMPVKEINELRRSACEKLLQELSRKA
ncbi:peptidase U32 family protein [Butyrivibrio fibrisolvens]|uniref:peptidase U32 family protein n=1 Tax=Butyrivibrio fibrisolvens TaxID=831 RepID=UPI00040705AD|nr:U32 family peptidase [Butyrivibrio fibrisolvens]